MRWTLILLALTGCFLIPVETECTPLAVLDTCLDGCVDDADVCFLLRRSATAPPSAASKSATTRPTASSRILAVCLT